MPVLGDFAVVRNNLLTAKRATVAMLHQFVFESEGDRGNRKRLRMFEGFCFNEGDDQYKQKAEYVKTHITTSDLVSICCLLGIDYDEEDLFKHVFVNLKKGMLLTSATTESGDDETENEDDEIDEGQNSASDGDAHDETIVNARNNKVEVFQHNNDNDDEQEHHNDKKTTSSKQNKKRRKFAKTIPVWNTV